LLPNEIPIREGVFFEKKVSMEANAKLFWSIKAVA
jgi:hypothetical protein